MRSLLRKCKKLLAFIPGLMVASVGFADDTEVFFNTPNTSIKPNILFILDNSGSMATRITTQSVFDPTASYSGSYSDSYIYFTDRRGYIRRIHKGDNKCDDAITRLSKFGYITSYQMAYFYSPRNRWYSLPDSNVNVDTECFNDRGIHGENAGSGNKYIRNHRNMWGTSSREASWRNVAYRNFYSANYLNWYFNHRVSTSQTRLEIVQNVATNLANSMTGVNVGLMAFNTSGSATEGGHMLLPIGDIDTNRAQFITQVNAMTPYTWTPLAESLFEGLRYYEGERPFLDASPIASVMSGSNYKSPIQNECQSNNIVVLTDGEPTYDADPTSRYYDSNTDLRNHNTIEAKVGNCSGNCLDEISKYMTTKDITNKLSGDQHINTYTVGFDINNSLLKNTAINGGGADQYYLANDAESLENAFNAIVRKVLATSTTFVAPGIAVNTFNRLNHLDTLYFSVFEPRLEPNWQGNLKRYQLASGGIVTDADGEEAVDDSTGFFKRSSRSWWSATEDGPDVASGGASFKQKDVNADRNVYTYYAGSASRQLTNSVNAVTVANKANITKTMFGDASMSDATHEQLINWTRGADVFDEDGDSSTTDSRHFISDPLHSKPHLLIYGGTADSPDVSVFFGDNQGFLHAINGNTGETHFSFIPEELLDNQQILMDNSADSDRTYGVDGSVASWQYDYNKDGVIGGSDHVYIYFGMRRGGNSYYALNVTNRNSPEVLFTIKGGTGDFKELGQTWSKPVKTKIRIGNSDKDVLIFAGGYDTNQDSVTVRTADTIGRALYIVDAETGARLWWAGPASSGADEEYSDMQYSMPATPKALDTNGDGLADQIYIGDMGGQVWRFDINNGERASALVDGDVIANFAGSTTQTNRRFYNTPDLFGFKYGNKRYLGLVIGSGYRAHPLNAAVEDRIYMLRIPDASAPPDSNLDDTTDYRDYGWTESDLYDATDNLIGEGTNAQQAAGAASLAGAKGWYLRLIDYADGTYKGEKVLSESTTVNNQIFITTYEPSPNTSGCVPLAGKSRLYHLWAEDAQPVKNYDKTVKNSDTELTKEDRIVELMDPLPPDPQRMRVDGEDVICVGARCAKEDTITGIIETFWYQDEE